MEPQRVWTIASSSWKFLRKRWLDREQELIMVIQEETKRTEEKGEAGFRSPTWSIPRAPQKINKAMRLEGEAIISAPPFSHSAGRGDLRLWGEDDGPIVVAWERLSKSEQEHWSKKMGESKHCVIWCRSREKDEEQHPFEADGKEIFSNCSKQTKAEAGETMDKIEERRQRAVNALESVVATEQHQMRSEQRAEYASGDGSDKKGKMGAGFNNSRRKKEKQQCKVG